MSTVGGFAQYQLRFVDDIQHDYEVIRPIVPLVETIVERSRQTGSSRLSWARKPALPWKGCWDWWINVSSTPGRKGHVYPEAVAAHILYLKQLYPPIHDREIVRIVQRKFGYTTNHHTVHHFLELPSRATGVAPAGLFRVCRRLSGPVLDRRPDAVRRVEQTEHCWLSPEMARSHVYAIIAAFERDGFEGPRINGPALPHPDDQLTLPFLKEVLDLQQEYPRAGAFVARAAATAAWSRPSQ